MNKPFFLAKSGQIYGPYDRNEIESLRESGEYERYTWFWDDSIGRWNPIDPPPAAPRNTQHVAPAAATAERVPYTAPASTDAAPQFTVSSERLKSISAICHDRQQVVSGSLSNVTDAGCEFVVSGGSTLPDFQTKLSVSIHLLDVTSGHSMNVLGKIGRVERRGGSWVYRIHWKHCPKLLHPHAAAA